MKTTQEQLFSKKYLERELKYDLSKITDLEGKKSILKKWKSWIDDGTIDTLTETQLNSRFTEVFEQVLGYTTDISNEYNFEREEKTETDSTRPDGVLGYISRSSNEKDIRVVIEYKDSKTLLDKPQNRLNDKRTPVEQGFSYVSKSGGNVKWVIVSNFKELRLYPSNDSSKYQLFEIRDLLEDEKLRQFLGILSKDRLFIPSGMSPTDKLLKERQDEEENITNEFYNKYKTLRSQLYHHLKKENPDKDEILILGKTQKILDRIIFICFCEDLGLLPFKTFRHILDFVKQDKFNRRDTKLWERVKGLFESVDKGYPQENINKFNGGLFKTDEELDNLTIKDEVLEHILEIEKYDFESELNVNILGHIFEQSITDLEELKSEIEGEDFDKKKGKRKKDGVFYTPEYITKYIVKESVGGWLEDRKVELGFDKLEGIDEKEWEQINSGKVRKGSKLQKKIKTHIETWEKYRDKVFNIKVIDPSCGSGSFLVQVFDFLKQEGVEVNEMIGKLQGKQPELFTYDKHILSNNIYGVDINPESVEITKLSLWLKTMNKNEELTTLDENIKCGNSLIDDPSVDPVHSFKWEDEFPKIFKNGGFDVVVGNPPYLHIQGLKEHFEKETDYYEKNYVSTTGRYDFYVLFIEKSFKLINKKGIVSYILPHKFTNSDFGIGIRGFLSKNKGVKSIINFGSDMVFENVSTYTCILTLSHNNKEVQFLNISPSKLKEGLEFNTIPIEQLGEGTWSFKKTEISSVLDKIKKSPLKLKDIFKGVFQGIITGDNKSFCLLDCKIEGGYIEGYTEVLGRRIKVEKDIVSPLLKGQDIKRYNTQYEKTYIIYPYQDNHIIEEDVISSKYPKCYEYLLSIKERLENRGSKSMNYPRWYSLWNHRNIKTLTCKEKILTPDVCSYTSMSYDKNGEFFYNDTSYGLIKKDDIKLDTKLFLTILNSKLSWFFLKNTGTTLRGGYFRFKTKYLEPFCFPKIPQSQQKPFIEKCDVMLEKNKELQDISIKFLDLLKSDFEIEKMSNKLEKWYELDWGEFETELKKKKIILKGEQKEDWYDRFKKYQTICYDITQTLQQTDKEIDSMVYDLYGLTDEEIKIVEGE